MGKATALWGKTSGKVGALVYATSGGETIVREYNPNVANPSTTAQVDQRARMKLMSQLSASLAPSLAMQKNGLVSARNKFTKINFGNTYALNGVAQCSYENLQLTEGNLGLPQISARAGRNSSDLRILHVWLAQEPANNVSRIVWTIFSKSQEGKLMYVASYVATERIEDDHGIQYPFGYTFQGVPEGDLVIYGYGMIDTSERATAQYGNLNVVDGSDIAKLVATRAINFTDYQFTQTRGATMGASGTTIDPTPAGSVRIFATALGDGGTVTGGGTYEIGASVTLTATAATGYHFVRFIKNGTSETISTSNPYTFNAATQLDIVAVFEVGGQDSL